MTISRPELWPLHDLNGTNLPSADDEYDYLYSGYPVGLPVPSAQHNHKFKRGGEWHKYLDLLGLRLTDWHDTATSYRVSSTALNYTTGTNVLDPNTGATVSSRGVYIVQGTRIETDETFLNPVAGAVYGDPLVMTDATVPGRIWVYANSSGEVRYESVGPAVADSPEADELTLTGLQLAADGEVTSVVVASFVPEHRLVPTIQTLYSGSGTMLAALAGGVTGGDAAFVAYGGIGPAAEIESESPTDAALTVINTTGVQALDVQGSAAVSAELTVGTNISVGGNVGLSTSSANIVAVNGTTTFNAPVTVADGQAFVANGNATIGNASGDVITIGGTTTFNAPVTVANGQTLTANGNVVLGNADTDTCTVNATTTFASNVTVKGNTTIGDETTDILVVKADATFNDGIKLLAGAGASADGEVTYDGRSLEVGDGATRRTIRHPYVDYVASDDTSSLIDDLAGSLITLVIEDTQFVYISVECHQLVNTAGEQATLHLSATNGVDDVDVLNASLDDVATSPLPATTANGQQSPNRLFIRWRPTNDVVSPDNTTWSIYVRHGVTGGGTVTTTKVFLQVWYA